MMLTKRAEALTCAPVLMNRSRSRSIERGNREPQDHGAPAHSHRRFLSGLNLVNGLK
jgi:hypothetical protein